MTKKVGFEKQLEKLEKIREELETGELTLDQAIKLYESGVKQLRLCQEQLAGYEARIKELSPFDEDESESGDEES